MSDIKLLHQLIAEALEEIREMKKILHTGTGLIDKFLL